MGEKKARTSHGKEAKTENKINSESYIAAFYVSKAKEGEREVFCFVLFMEMKEPVKTKKNSQKKKSGSLWKIRL